ncbi:MAG: hypothetical protein ACKVZ0_15905 [Gemmatimonadales bacterium]
MLLTLVANGLLVGCSGPAAEPVAQPVRDVSLVQPAVSDAPLVSPLESGRPAPVRAPARRQASRPKLDPVAVVAMDRAPTVSASATTAVSEIVEAPMAVAPAAEPLEVVVGRGIEPSYGGGQMITPDLTTGRRGPSVVIRGGRGGIHDDCDIHRPGVRRVPMAINQVAPPRMSFPRGGIR